MNATFYAIKFLSLIMTLRNPCYFFYRSFHYLNKYIPRRWATCIYRKNQKEYIRDNVHDYLLETYDGSGQAVHPDIAFWKNDYWLTMTPYPYGMEEYENPCIYQGDSLNHMSIPKNPIAVQHKHTQGVHLSDPCFAIDRDILFCYYRESERKGTIEENTIWGMEYSESNKCWNKPKLILTSEDDKILSPAMIFDVRGYLIVYYVSTLNDSYTLVKNCGNTKGLSLCPQSIDGMPRDYYLWHIGIKKTSDINDSVKDDNKLMGLFLMKSIKDKSKMKLFEAEGNLSNNKWFIKNEIKIPVQLSGIISFPYKSCYIPKRNGEILLSYCDKKHRYRLLVI